MKGEMWSEVLDELVVRRDKVASFPLGEADVKTVVRVLPH
jgi:hypothetical protein